MVTILGVKATWLGHGSFKLETSSGRIVYLDPWIEGNPVCPIKLADITKADIVCVTHGHIDHIGDSIRITKKTGAVFIGTPELGFFAQKSGIPEEGGEICALNIGGSCTIEGMEVIMTDAVHTSDIMVSETETVTGSGACGYVIVTEDNVSVYFAGDTGVFGDMRLIADLYAPQLAIVPVGGKYNMGVREAAYAAHLGRPRVFIPMHYGAFPDQEADLERLRELVRALAPATELVILKPGEPYAFPQ
ncbi:MAG: metal-dependent hydrolase [Candidatus Bathyarchaeota archaeon]|nr:metal-dependent hydrolase [Candidatus Bathyarchaeota archaeon]